jgi:hypothetical protein
MTALVEFLFPAPAPRRISSIVAWWERRRLAYNFIVGAAGIVSLTITHALLWLPPNGHLTFVPWQGVVLYAVAANVCYCLGPAADVTLQLVFQRRVLPPGPTLYRMGLTFAVGLTFMPTLIAAADWAVRMLGVLF